MYGILIVKGKLKRPMSRTCMHLRTGAVAVLERETGERIALWLNPVGVN